MTDVNPFNSEFAFVDAKYRKEPNPLYAGNPYVEALPSLPTDLELAKALTYLPPFDAGERALDAPARIQRLDTIEHIVIALPRMVRLARAILRMLVAGYGPRRPFSASDNKTVRDLYALQQNGRFCSLRQTQLAIQHSMALIGASGCGKTFSLHQILGLLPPAIYHEQLGKWQLPALYLEMAYDGESVHTLASAIFTELDRLLPDGRYLETYMHRKGLNAEQRLAKALAIAYELGVGIIATDESQNRRDIGNESAAYRKANKSTGERESPLMKLLITASNTSHIPIVFAGTLEMRRTMGGRFTRARRMAGQGSTLWLPFTRYSEEPGKKGEFELLLRALFRYQFVRNPIEYSDGFADAVFDLTQGIPDIISKLWRSSQELAIANGQEKLTTDILRSAFDAEFVLTEHGIHAVKNQDDWLGRVVPDLYLPATSREGGADADGCQFPAPEPTDCQRPRPPRPKKAKPAIPSPSAAEIEASKLEGSDLRELVGKDDSIGISPENLQRI